MVLLQNAKGYQFVAWTVDQSIRGHRFTNNVVLIRCTLAGLVDWSG